MPIRKELEVNERQTRGGAVPGNERTDAELVAAVERLFRLGPNGNRHRSTFDSIKESLDRVMG